MSVDEWTDLPCSCPWGNFSRNGTEPAERLRIVSIACPQHGREHPHHGDYAAVVERVR